MSAATRHVIVLDKFFSNYKQKAYIFVEKDFEYVKCLEDHIVKIFKLKTQIFLTNDQGIFYPSREKINVIEPKDILIAHPLNSLEANQTAKTTNIDVTNDNFTEPRRKKSRKGSLITPCEEVEPMVLNDSDDSVVLNVFNHLNISNSNASDGEENKTKRKRIRKRKKNVVAINDEGKQNISKIEPEQVVAPPKSFRGLHIRFDDDYNKEKSENKYDTEKNKNRKARVIRAFYDTTIESTNKSQNDNDVVEFINHEVKEELIEKSTQITAPNANANLTEHEINSLETFHEICARLVFDEYPIIDYLPKQNDMISFRILKLDDNYVPQITKDIFGTIVSLDTTTKDLTLKILHGKEETKEPEGKFTLPADDDSNTPVDPEEATYFNTNLMNLHEVRVIVPAKGETETSDEQK